MKRTRLLASVMALLVTGLYAGIVTEDDGDFREPVKASKNVAKGGPVEVAIPPLFGREGVFIASLCSSASPNLTRSRVNAMAWMAGVPVPTDRMQDPAAWYAVTTDGLQWFDPVSSSGFHCWIGTTTITNGDTAGEYGNRIVIHAFGKYPVSAYSCRIVSTVTNIGYTEFPIGTNTANGLEIPFNANFIGIGIGVNGTLESWYDPSIGTFRVSGDDTVYSNGELPSTVSYDWWYRFGATIAITVSDPSGFNSIRNQFVPTLQSLFASLVKGGNEIGKMTVVEARPSLLVAPYDHSSILVTVQGGQLWMPYEMWSVENLTGASWDVFYHQALYTGQPVLVPKPDPMRFFRLVSVLSP